MIKSLSDSKSVEYFQINFGTDDTMPTKSTIILMYFLSFFYALPGTAQYLGGGDDGHARANAPLTLGISPMYYGGNDDGFSLALAVAQSLAFPQPMFFGGNDDGFSLASVASQSLAFPQPMFFGGNDDGFSLASVASQSLAFPQPMFFGGNDDGFSLASVASQSLAFPQPMFFGGNDDGFALGFASVQSLGMATMYYGGGGDGQSAVISFDTPLPLEYMTIAVKWKKSNAIITWKTAGEYHTDHFNVERSTNGLEFHRLAKIAGAKTMEPVDRHYTYEDTEAIKMKTEVIYYRIQQVDWDGAFTYSPVVALYKNSEALQWNIFAYPNPVADEFVLNIEGARMDKTEVRLTDVNGKTWLRQPAESKVTVNVRDLASGVYFLTVSNGSNIVQTLRIIVTH